MQVMLPMDGGYGKSKVFNRKKDTGRTPVGDSIRNLMLEYRAYNAKFDYGTLYEYAENIISENMYAYVDEKGREHLLTSEIIEHQRDESTVNKEYGFITCGSNKNRRNNTKGWQLLVTWKDGRSTWESLKDFKESNLVKVS